MSPIADGKAQPVYGVADLQASAIARVTGSEFGVEAHVNPFRVIEKLETGQQGHIGKHILYEQCLSPTAVSHDNVRNHATIAQTATYFRN